MLIFYILWPISLKLCYNHLLKTVFIFILGLDTMINRRVVIFMLISITLPLNAQLATITFPAVTAAAVTVPAATVPPVTGPAVTAAGVTVPAATLAPVTGPVVEAAAATVPAETVPAETVPPTTEPTVTIATPCLDGLTQINPQNCSTYKTCIDGQLTEQSCPVNSFINCTFSACLDPTVQFCCAVNDALLGQFCLINGIKIMDPFDCHSYYVCTNNQITQGRCGDLYYDWITTQCVDTNVTCVTSVEEIYDAGPNISY